MAMSSFVSFAVGGRDLIVTSGSEGIEPLDLRLNWAEFVAPLFTQLSAWSRTTPRSLRARFLAADPAFISIRRLADPQLIGPDCPDSTLLRRDCFLEAVGAGERHRG